ncbi:MAG: TOBE-like domain-containing protein, partial [Planctomycetaceae bacterium]
PHELEIDRHAEAAALQATILQVTPAGSLQRVRLLAEGYGVELNVDVARERADQLQLRPGEQVFVRPKTARVFMPEPEYVI